MVPVIFFGLERFKLLIISIILLSPAILLFDYFNNLAGIHIKDLKYDGKFYPVFVTVISVSYSFAILGLMFAQRFNISFRKRIQVQNNEILREKKEIQALNKQLQFQSNLYSILDVTSKNRNLMFTLQDVLEQLLKLDGLSARNKGAIFLKNKKNDFEIAAHQNIDPLESSSEIRLICNDSVEKNRPPTEGISTNNQYIVSIRNRDMLIGAINIYINDGEAYNKNTEIFLDNVATILSRKILDDQNKEKLKLKNIEFKNQRHILNSTLTELNKSITYAQYLQKSLIPNQNTIDKYFEDSSFLFKPRDKVSGDFYFAHEVEDNLYFGIGDCTGHGIPGAFLAAMSIEAVNTVVKNSTNKSPDNLLTQLRTIAKERFSVNLNDKRSDAMDAALCLYNKKEDKLYYSGGFINLIIVRNNNEIVVIPATKCPIGSYPVEPDFELHKIDLQKGDVIYLSSDGYPDQFGYDKNSNATKPKKFKRKPFRELLMKISHLPCDEQVGILKSNIKDWRGDIEQTDDITVFIAKH